MKFLIYPFARALAIAIASARARAIALAIAIDIARARAIAIARVKVKARARARASAIARVKAIVYFITHSLTAFICFEALSEQYSTCITSDNSTLSTIFVNLHLSGLQVPSDDN